LRKRALVHVGLGGLLLLVVTTGVGLVFMWFFDDGPIGDADRAGAEWLEDRRTPTLNTWTEYGSMLSETLVKVVLVAVVGGALVLIVRRWHDGVFLALAVSLEATVFVIASFIVDRDRPPVEQLDPPAPSGSFPSGHAGAAVAFYAGLFIVVCWHTRNRIVRAIFVVVAVAAPLAVGFSRAARGMHHPIDVAAGMLVGVGALYVVRGAFAKGVDEIDREADSSVAERVRRLDVTTLRGGQMTNTTLTNETGSRKVEHLAHRHRSLVTVARLGWVAKGVVYGVLGLLAVSVALHGSDAAASDTGRQEASPVGAVAEIADTSFGEVALYAVAVGLALYTTWRLLSVVLPAQNSAKAWLTRAGYLVSAAVYAVLAWSALSFAGHDAAQGSSQNDDARVERFTTELMDKTGGRWLVGGLGIGVVALGIFFVVRGVGARFRDELEPGGVGPVSQESIVTIGRVGWVGRGIVMGLVGWLLIRAAVLFRPDEAKGIDGALRDVTGSTFGAVLVGFAAVALVLYGLFCVISAPRQRLAGSG